MLLLLPFLLLTTSPNKLASIDMRLLGDDAVLPGRPGPIESLSLAISPTEAVIEASVRKTDVLAAEGQTELQRFIVPSRNGAVDYSAVQDVLLGLKRLDPDRTAIELVPADELPSAVVMAVIDASRSAGGERLFPDVVLGGQAP